MSSDFKVKIVSPLLQQLLNKSRLHDLEGTGCTFYVVPIGCFLAPCPCQRKRSLLVHFYIYCGPLKEMLTSAGFEI
jgi:ABC-type antimicrobial peptide transport system ATPase subunit